MAAPRLPLASPSTHPMYLTSNEPGLNSTQPMSCLKCTPACPSEDSLRQRGHVSSLAIQSSKNTLNYQIFESRILRHSLFNNQKLTNQSLFKISWHCPLLIEGLFSLGGLLKLLIFTFFHCKFMRVTIFFQKISFYKNYLYMYMCLFSSFIIQLNLF